MSLCETCVVSNRAICSALDSTEMGQLNRIGRQIEIKKGHTLMWEGEDSLVVASIVVGIFKLSSSLEDGREQIISLAFPADFVGRPFGKKNEYSVEALTDARLCVFSRADFDNFARSHPDLEHKLLERTLDQLDDARRWILLLGRKTASERVASFLMEISTKLGVSGCSANNKKLTEFELPFGRKQMADILGLTIETVSRQLTRFKNEGLIDLPDRRNIRILENQKLQALSEAAA